jgi:NTP pyrophosphatase (non-canonical NTP hydrolase)
MNFKEFLDFVDYHDDFLQKSKVASTTDREKILSRTVKVSEEFGELCDEILSSMGGQRESKTLGKDADSLSEEFADTVITVFLLGKSLGIDIPLALSKKIEKIKSKHNKEIEL